MKKTFFTAVLFFSISLVVGFVFYFKTPSNQNTIFLNAYDVQSYAQLQKLSEALKRNGYKTVFSGKDSFKSGLFNLYATSTYENLPPVIDKDAINFLWLPSVEEGKPEVLRPYDVIVVQNASFAYLKAINVRSAYIPKAINITKNRYNVSQNKAMFYGDNDTGFSLSLYLAGPTDLKVDVFGNGFSGVWSEDEIMRRPVKSEDFQQYPVVLVDQSEEDIRDERIGYRLAEVLEKGGLPYIRYNSGVAKLFGEAVPMYMSEEEFSPQLKSLLSSPHEIMERREAIRKIAEGWNTDSQAKKFIELFEVMKKKMR